MKNNIYEKRLSYMFYNKHFIDKLLFNEYHLGYTLIDNDGYFLNFRDLNKFGNIVFEFNFNNDCLTCSRSNAIAMRDLVSQFGIICKIETVFLDSDFKFFW